MHMLHLPRLGQTMERGTVVRWLKDIGEPYQIGDLLYELEYEKASVEVEAKLPGTLAAIVVETGENLPVGSLLAVVADPGETLSPAQIEAAVAAEKGAAATTAAPAATTAAAPATAPGAGAGRARAMPRARVLAQQLGLDLASIAGTGDGGAITVADVQRAAQVASGPRVRERHPLRGIPRAMAESMTRSWQQAPQFTQMVMVDASALVARRQAAAEEYRRARHGRINLSFGKLKDKIGAADEAALVVSIGNYKHEKYDTLDAARLHTHRTPRCYSHHSRLGRLLVSGLRSSAGRRAPRHLPLQPAPDRPRLRNVPR